MTIMDFAGISDSGLELTCNGSQWDTVMIASAVATLIQTTRQKEHEIIIW